MAKARTPPEQIEYREAALNQFRSQFPIEEKGGE
jgi:hypothetical protein